MAVEYISAETVVNDNTSSGSTSITIPADCTLVLVSIVGWAAAWIDDAICDQLNFDNGSDQDFTKIVHQRFAAGFPDAVLTAMYMTTADGDWPGTGAQTLYYRFYGNNAPSQGAIIKVTYWKGVDTSDPIGDTESEDWGGGDFLSALTGVGAGDMGILLGRDKDGTPDVDPGGSGQTAIEESQYNDCGMGLGYKLGESALDMDEATELVPAAFALNAASGTAVTKTGSMTPTGAATRKLEAARSLAGAL